MKVILIGTGTPNPDPTRSGPCVGVYYKKQMYLVDFGVGLVRQINQISQQLDFKISNLNMGMITHLHSDHTLGFSDLILTPWILGRQKPLKVFGPKGTKAMTGHLIEAYSLDIYERINGLERANTNGCDVYVTEIKPGIIYDEDIRISAIPVVHGNFEAYAYKFEADGKSIVISGDTAPCQAIIDAAQNCDILVHEVYYAEGLKTRSPQWQKYHSSVHTSAIELGQIAETAQVKKLVLYHQLFMQEHILEEGFQNKDYQDKILNEVKIHYNGNIVYGEDLLIIE